MSDNFCNKNQNENLKVVIEKVLSIIQSNNIELATNFRNRNNDNFIKNPNENINNVYKY